MNFIKLVKIILVACLMYWAFQLGQYARVYISYERNKEKKVEETMSLVCKSYTGLQVAEAPTACL